MCKISQIMLIVPVTTTERSFSRLKLLKTYIRNSCGQERLSRLAMMAMHTNIPLDYATIVAKFLNAKPRRIET